MDQIVVSTALPNGDAVFVIYSEQPRKYRLGIPLPTVDDDR